MQNYVIKLVMDLQQVGGFLRVLRFPPPIKLTTDITEILLKVTLNTINTELYHRPHIKTYQPGTDLVVY
jgi:hypothetical protein